MTDIIRKTKISETLITLLKKEKKPKTVPQLLEQLKRINITPNKTTIYRQVQKLKQAKIISEIILKNGISYYEYSNKHHHHFFCTGCESIFCLDKCQIHAENQLRNQVESSFTISHHEFNLYGKCSSCNSPDQTIKLKVHS